MLGRRGIGGLVAAAGLMAACGSTASAPPTAKPASAVPVTVVTPAPTPVPTPAGFAVGFEVDTTTNAKITVEQLAPAHSGNEFETPPAGGRFLAAKIKECAGDSQLLVSPSEWSVKLADDTQVDGTELSDGTPGPVLPTSNVQSGNCVAGWAYFPLPPSPAPTQIEPSNTDFYWTLPPGT